MFKLTCVAVILASFAGMYFHLGRCIFDTASIILLG